MQNESTDDESTDDSVYKSEDDPDYEPEDDLDYDTDDPFFNYNPESAIPESTIPESTIPESTIPTIPDYEADQSSKNIQILVCLCYVVLYVFESCMFMFWNSEPDHS